MISETCLKTCINILPVHNQLKLGIFLMHRTCRCQKTIKSTNPYVQYRSSSQGLDLGSS